MTWRAALDLRVEGLGASYLAKLPQGLVVEQLISGEIQSPSVQMRILPSGQPVALSTNDQVLGGEFGQTFVGCRFPAERAYAASIVREARKAGDYLAARGLTGRFGIDFIVARRGSIWKTYAVDMNLREGGTSHPYESLCLLTGGSLDPARTTFRTPCGQAKHYFATDRLKHPDYRGVGVKNFLAEATLSELGWNPASQTGAVFHLLRSLEEHGRIGVTAIGDTPDQANELYRRVARLLDRLAAESAATQHHNGRGDVSASSRARTPAS